MWVLILSMVAAKLGGITTQEFSTKQACYTAGQTAKRQHEQGGNRVFYGVNVQWSCVYKG